MESFNGRMRDEFLNETLFRNLAHVRDLIAAWVADYNTERPYGPRIPNPGRFHPAPDQRNRRFRCTR